jgi:hypothetical protein
MLDVEAVILGELRQLSPFPSNATADWLDVLRRAGLRSPTISARRRHPRLVLAAVLVAIVGVLAAAALATGLGDRLSAWVSGRPGRPAPAEIQQGFDAANRAAYAAFPAGTKLRLLLARTVSGTRFSLLGFRNGDAYCLRLIRSDHPQAIGGNECLRANELSGVPALVAGDAQFRVGAPAKSFNGVYGFAADSVRSLVITRLRSSDRVPVVNNVFLSLRGQPSGTVQHHPLRDPVIGVHALMRAGGRETVPYVADGQGIIPGGKRPSGPSYFARGSQRSIPGPSRVTAPIAKPTIHWLLRREPRGTPLTGIRFSNPSFGRVIQPDPYNPVRIGIAAGARGALCDYYFAPLAPRSWGGGCGPWFSLGAIRLGSWYSGPIQHFNGFVADGINRVTVYLASGRTIRAALLDNVFTVAVSAAELPGRIVGYDANGRVAGVAVLPGNAVLKACPSPAFTAPTSSLPAAKRWERINLATMQVNGQMIIGKTTDRVRAILGTPTTIIPAAQTTNGVAIPEYRYGGKSQSDIGLSIRFNKNGGRIVANTLTYRSPSVVDAQLGHILHMTPQTLQARIAKTYSSRYRLYLRYGADPGRGCTAVALDRTSPRGLIFGIDPYNPSRPYLIIRANGGAG